MTLALRDLPTELRDQVVASCRDLEPTASAVLVHGSYVTGTADEGSDLDLDIFVAGPPTVFYRTWFEHRGDGLPLHVSARSDLSLDVWEQEAGEPEDWAFGLPVELEHVWLWVGDDRLRSTLGERPVLRKPGASPEVEDMVDALVKARRAMGTGDDLGVRLAAQAAARYAAPCVAVLNSPDPVRDPRAALDALRGLPLAPEHWTDDVTTCLGLSGRSTEEVFAAAQRLVPGVLRLLRETDPHADKQPDVARYLLDGTFERLLAT